MVAAWLAEQGAPADVAARAEALVRVHEEGGDPEADVLQAADSLSFLETMVPARRSPGPSAATARAPRRRSATARSGSRRG